MGKLITNKTVKLERRRKSSACAESPVLMTKKSETNRLILKGLSGDNASKLFDVTARGATRKCQLHVRVHGVAVLQVLW